MDAVLTAFHDAASRADGTAYFNLLSDDAIYLGTDAAERWTVDEFRAFAEPYFSKGRGWTYTATTRNIVVGPDGSTAWFDGILTNRRNAPRLNQAPRCSPKSPVSLSRAIRADAARQWLIGPARSVRRSSAEALSDPSCELDRAPSEPASAWEVRTVAGPMVFNALA